MTDELRIVVHGEPGSQGSKSRTRYGGMYESSKKLKPWRKAVTEAAEAAIADGAPTFPKHGVLVGIGFRFERPGNHYRSGRFSDQLRPTARRTPCVKPDIDKITRSTYDALTKAGAWTDDCQVVAEWHIKEYVTRGDGRQPGATIIVRAASVLDEPTGATHPSLRVVR